jgi:hypothetical protein
VTLNFLRFGFKLLLPDCSSLTHSAFDSLLRRLPDILVDDPLAREVDPLSSVYSPQCPLLSDLTLSFWGSLWHVRLQMTVLHRRSSRHTLACTVLYPSPCFSAVSFFSTRPLSSSFSSQTCHPRAMLSCLPTRFCEASSPFPASPASGATTVQSGMIFGARFPLFPIGTKVVLTPLDPWRR